MREIVHATGTIITVAGLASGGVPENGGPATAAALGSVNGIALDSAGDLFLADGNGLIQEVNYATGIITTIAGTGTLGDTGDGGPATAAEVDNPEGIAVDSAGDVFFADPAANRVREIHAATGLITTIAGTGTAGSNGDNVPATAAELYAPTSVAVDSAGDVFISDGGNFRVREVNASTGLISTIAGTGATGAGALAPYIIPSGVALDAFGNLYISDAASEVVYEMKAITGAFSTVVGSGLLYNGPASGPATPASISFPGAVAFDNSGDMFIPDVENNDIVEVTAAAQVTVTGTPPTSSVARLPPRTSLTSIPVSWSGTAGSNGPITSYDVLVSTDGGPFVPWLTQTTATTGTFTAHLGHTYGFISRAHDAAGDVEATRAIADTTVTTTTAPFHNTINPLDVLGQGGPIVPADALLVINYLNLHPGDGSLPPTAPAGSDDLDVLGTGAVVPADALAIINYLNLHPQIALAAVGSADAPGNPTDGTAGEPANLIVGEHAVAADAGGVLSVVPPITPATQAASPVASGSVLPPASGAALPTTGNAVQTAVQSAAQPLVQPPASAFTASPEPPASRWRFLGAAPRVALGVAEQIATDPLAVDALLADSTVDWGAA